VACQLEKLTSNPQVIQAFNKNGAGERS
jgi:hypothetical protein